jgi:hypothetical protein
VTAAFALVGSGPTYPEAVAANSPVGYWRLNESAGPVAADSAGSNPGTYAGAVPGVPGLLASASNTAASFSGTNQNVRVPTSASLSPTAAVTLEAWIKPTALPGTGLFASVLTKAGSYSLQFNGSKLEFTIVQSGTRRRLQAPAGAIVVGSTYHIVGAYDGSAQRLYINGTQVAQVALTGAITATSMVSGSNPDEIWGKIIAAYSTFAGRDLTVLQDVYESEAATNQRNQAIAMLMYAYGHIKDKPLQATDIYTEQCSVSVNAKDLATMAGTLAAAGKNPVTGKQVMKAANVPYVLAVMATAGLYDDSGKWLYRTGLPGKSGVGGGLIAVSPGKFGIAVVSPPLDDAGNSVKGQKAITAISNALGGNPYMPKK